MSILDQVASQIIKEQELIIGPLAWREAGKVNGIHIIDQKSGAVTVENGDSKHIIDMLVAQYDRLFGRASREVSREAAAPLLAHLAASERPLSLQ
jgi:hypothetical protein